MLKIYRRLKPYTLQIVAIVALVFLQVISDLYLPTIMSDIVNSGIMKEDVSYILRQGLFMLLISGGGAVCAVVASFLSSRLAMQLGRGLRSDIFTRVESFSLNEFDRFGASTLITRTTNDIVQIQSVTIMILSMVLRAPVMCIGGVMLAYSKDSRLTTLLVISLPVVAAIVFLIAKFVIPLFRQMQKKIDRLNLVLSENLKGIRVIRAFNRESSEQERFEKANADLTGTYIKVNRILAILMPAMMLLMNVLMVGILWFGTIRIDAGEMNLGALVAFLQYAMQIMFALVMMTVMFIMIPRAQAAADRINEVLEAEPSVRDASDAHTADSKRGFVEFDHVTFRYSGAEEPVLKDISFCAKPGQTTAIIGGTGSGKSTLVNLIPRFYDVENGRVLVDGVDVREIPQEQLHRKIGFVPQKAVLFTGSVADNLRYGKKDANDAELLHAAQVAQADGFLSELKEGFATILAEGGQNLSGGQKQRLAIARAVVRKPEIYVFDDSFSALDFKTDAKLRAALRKETSDATVIIVAQRVGSVMNADQIVVLDEGTVAGIGTHRELLDTCEIYREIVSSQLSQEEMA
jgi:ATP-binding cassette subfamily B multidrug efflux pump